MEENVSGLDLEYAGCPLMDVAQTELIWFAHNLFNHSWRILFQ